MPDIEQVTRTEINLWQKIFSRLEISTRESRATKAWLVLVGGAMAGFAQLPFPLPDAAKASIGIIGVLMALLGGYLSFRYDTEDLATLQSARDVVDLWKTSLAQTTANEAQMQQKLTDLSNVIRHESSLALAHETVLIALENALVLDKADKATRLQKFLTAASRRIIGPMGLGKDHEWTISIFLREQSEEGPIMKRVASNWTDRDAEENDKRTWRFGKGWTGKAWQYGEEKERTDNFVVLKDTSDPEMVPNFDTGGQEEPDDYTRFRSVACIPFRVVGDTGVTGVVTATSSRIGAFAVQTGTPGRRNFDTIKSFTRVIVALLSAGDRK